MKGGSAKPLRVLIVEDSQDDAYFLLRELRKGGYDPEYLRVDTLAAATEALAGERWDLVISDYRLPRFTALDVLALARERTLDTPIIVISGAIGEDLAVETMRAGAHDYIMKDRMVRLCPAIERELREAQVRHERQQAARALRESEERFRELTETIAEVFWMIDRGRGRMTYVSPVYEKIWMRSSAPLRERASTLLDTVHPEDYERVHTALECDGWAGFNMEYRIQLPDGGERWIHTRSFPVRGDQGAVKRIAGISADITERKRLEAEAQKLSRALEQAADAVMILDRDGRIDYVNGAFEDMSGYGRAEVLGRQPKMLRSGYQDDAFFAQVWRTLRSGLPFTDVFVSRRKDGELYYEEKTLTPMRDSRGDITHYVSTGRDITRRLRMQQRLQHAARHDAASGLANRIFFTERLAQAVLNARRTGRCVGVLCVGIDSVCLLGGDAQVLEEKLLPVIAERLRGLSGPKDVVARLEPERFALLRCETDAEALEAVARDIVTAFVEPVRADGYELFLSPNVGISLYPRDTEETDELLSNADLAMRASREQRRTGYRFFTRQLQSDRHPSR
ncbi:MAG: PAS domain S-box protein [Gammaproteobacteria bacterium]|nr:PAS domain S-box protein [Gammaproteobacteria bacterium]